MTTFDAEHGSDVQAEASAAPSEREAARKRLDARRGFVSHVVAYIVINAFLVMVWAVTGAGYFWPVWVLGGWGTGLILHAWDPFATRPITEDDVDTELRRHRR